MKERWKLFERNIEFNEYNNVAISKLLPTYCRIIQHITSICLPIQCNNRRYPNRLLKNRVSHFGPGWISPWVSLRFHTWKLWTSENINNISSIMAIFAACVWSWAAACSSPCALLTRNSKWPRNAKTWTFFPLRRTRVTWALGTIKSSKWRYVLIYVLPSH